MAALPVLFVSHGAPTFALEPGEPGSRLRAIGAGLADRVEAVVVLSPHWMTRALAITSVATPATIRDFGGFDPALYRLQYPVAGAPALATEVRDRLAAAGIGADLDPQRGLDHGAWVPLMHLFPAADRPVLQVSMPVDLDPRGAFALGRALAPLRERGVLLVGSGSLTHNLYDLQPPGAPAAEYVRAFAEWIAAAIGAGDHDALVDYRRRAPQAERAHPTEDHYLPLPFAAGAANVAETARRLDGGVTYGVLSMDAYVWGGVDAAD